MYKSRKKHWKGLLSCLLAFFMAMAVFSVTASAEETSVDTWDGTADTTWYNDTDTEFHLTTAEQLAGLAEIVNNGNTWKGKPFSWKTIWTWPDRNGHPSATATM